MIRPTSPEPRTTTSFPIRRLAQVDEMLRRARGEDARGPGPGEADHLPCPFPAAHGQDHGAGPEEPVAVARGDAKEPVGRAIENHGAGEHPDAGRDPPPRPAVRRTRAR